jgi:hypothetical protein
MRKIILFNSMLFIFNTVFGQINFEDKVNIYDYDSLSVNIIYDDFDNDNDFDIIKYGVSNSGNILLQKNENGDFNANPSILVDTGKNLITSLDLNNDGFPDLITHQQFNTIGVLYNLQNDTFSEEETVQNLNGSYYMPPIKFDYNSDGFMDLIFINNNQNAYVLLNNQLGGLEPPEFIIPVGGGSNSIYQIDDFNNDGNFDFYIWENNRLKIYVYDEDNDNFFQPIALEMMSLIKLFGILDLDGNGYKDVLYLKNGAIWVKYFDFDDFIDEFIVLNDIMVVNNIPLINNSVNARKLHIEDGGNGIYKVYIAGETPGNQLNGRNQSRVYKFLIQNNVFSNAELITLNFAVNEFGVRQLNYIDLNNDDTLDITYTSNFNEQKMIFINNNINELNNKTICIQQVVQPSEFSVIDMNGDGVEDICMGTQNGLGYFEKNSNNELSDMRNLIGVMSNPNASLYTISHIDDFNNDGIGDVVDFMQFGNYAKIYKNLGNDDFEFIQSLILTSNSTSNIYFVDIDSDGYKDLLFESRDSNFQYNLFDWARNNNGVSFDTLQPLTINTSNAITLGTIEFSDFNNDDQTDILALSYFYENNEWQTEVILLENQNGQFIGSSLALLNGNYSRSHIKAHDFNQDGYLDFFVYSINDNPIYDYAFIYFKNDGQNNFESILIENLNIEDIEFYDNDDNGIYEIYAWNYDDSAYSNNIFYYTTTDYLTFTKTEIDSYSASYDFSDPSTRGDLILYDYNDDGKDDLFINNYSPFQGLISVYENVSETLGIEEVGNDTDLNQLQIYPNPFVDSINWISQEGDLYTLQLFSQSGKLLFEKTTSENSINFSSFNSGVYFLVFKEETLKHERVYKIIKK